MECRLASVHVCVSDHSSWSDRSVTHRCMCGRVPVAPSAWSDRHASSSGRESDGRSTGHRQIWPHSHRKLDHEGLPPGCRNRYETPWRCGGHHLLIALIVNHQNAIGRELAIINFDPLIDYPGEGRVSIL